MKNWKVWLYGLVAAAIGGAATVATGFAAGADWNVLWRMALYRAFVDVALYLKSSPLPQLIIESETVTDKPTGTEVSKNTVTVTKNE